MWNLLFVSKIYFLIYPTLVTVQRSFKISNPWLSKEQSDQPDHNVLYSCFVFSLTTSTQNTVFQSYFCQLLSLPPSLVRGCHSVKHIHLSQSAFHLGFNVHLVAFKKIAHSKSLSFMQPSPSVLTNAQNHVFTIAAPNRTVISPPTPSTTLHFICSIDL